MMAFLATILLVVPGSGAHAAVIDSLIDNEGIFTQEQEEALSQDISALRTRYDVYVGILTADTFNGMTGEEYARSQGNKLGLGESWKNNGFLFVISMNDHKVGFAYGDGVSVSSSYSQEIINDMLGYLKTNDPYNASIAGMKDLNSYFSVNGINSATDSEDMVLGDTQNIMIGMLSGLLVIVFVGMIVIAVRNAKRRKLIEKSPISRSQIKAMSTMNDDERRSYVAQNNYFGMDSSMFPWVALMYVSNLQRESDYQAAHPSKSDYGGSSFGGGSFGGGGASGSW